MESATSTNPHSLKAFVGRRKCLLYMLTVTLCYFSVSECLLHTLVAIEVGSSQLSLDLRGQGKPLTQTFHPVR